MTRKIELKNIAVLNNIISKRQPENIKDIISEHNQKRNIDHTCRNQYRPGSEDYIKVEEKRAKILALPDHDIVYSGDVIIKSSRYNETALDLTLGVYNDDEYRHDYDDDSVYIETVKYYFLVRNEYWLDSVYTKFSDLFTQYHNVLDHMMEDNKHRIFYELVDTYQKDYQKYFYLLKKDIKKALSYGYEVDITQDRGYHGFGKQYLKIDGLDGTKKHYLETLDEILKIEYYWYNDRKTKFGDNYHFNSVMEEYEYAKDNICVEENS